MRTDLELNGKRFMSDSARRNASSICNLKISGRCLETERDGVGLHKSGVDEGRNGAGVDHCRSLDQRALNDDCDRENEMFLGIDVGRRGVEREQGSRCGMTVTVTRTGRRAQRRILYCI